MPQALQRLKQPQTLPSLVAQVSIPYEEFELENGLKVIVHGRPQGTDRGQWRCGTNVGSKDEPEGKDGVRPPVRTPDVQWIEKCAGRLFSVSRGDGAPPITTAPPGFDRTNYFQTVPRPALERAAVGWKATAWATCLAPVTQGKAR